ncbi:hypothetical protein I204_00044 [Kwoniella mangroviensis CBS 8886]|uniref:uncharacterized protein n=1 Tax=Kwoniella mangroviensis CBS 8507 TaxID=1296122 RepID=UPI00080D799D|nr:uncharacterized protein I203_02778 [Kwoniella mangroviensis CBS 8507]OCF68117.1 hypothetical protein I203_02778 [Kwoniella mangroviensis CBS 8507]OCF78109.1 hypothetical protein I204_00044 [Kwoniella mangroviensis CBS 8886]
MISSKAHLLSLGMTLIPLTKALSGLITDPTQVSNQSFDYVIVGGGLGGLVVANRLSENPDISVLVIEAGSDNRDDPRVYDPYQYSVAFNTELDWNWPSSQGRSIKGGKTLGGSTSINGLAQTRGQKAQYDSLSTFLGGDDAGGVWNWDGMLFGMLKSEGFSAPNDQQKEAGASSNPALHNTSGPLQVTYPDEIFHGPQQKYFQTVVSTNFSVASSPDADDGNANVVAFHPNTMSWQDSDHRSSSATAYYSPVSERSNLAILLQHLATKIQFDGNKATGVEFGASSGDRYTVNANKEVIVSAGAIQTPALLQLSGVGDPALLNSLGINVVANVSGVGKNLQEQTMNSVGWTPIDGFDFQGRGPSDCMAYPDLLGLTSSSNNDIASTISANIGKYAQEAYDAGAVVSVEAANAIFAIQENLMVNNYSGLVEVFFDSGFPNGGLGIDLWQLLPFSRGTVKIKSTDPFEYPDLDPRYFAADVDLQIQIAGLRMARKIFQTAPLRSIVTEENAPGYGTVPEDGNGGSDEDWSKWIIDGFSSVYHPIATCSMMSQELGGVVGSDLKVYNTENLRIVDASVLPIQFSAHLSATLYGLAENAADM